MPRLGMIRLNDEALVVYVTLVEYTLLASTGESILISELDPERISDLSMRSWVESNPSTLSRCTTVTREVMEQAKIGYDKPFLEALSSPPASMLFKFKGSRCAHRKSCLSWSAPSCTLDGKPPKKRGLKLMQCWSYDGQTVDESEVLNAVVRAWLDGRNVVIIRDVLPILPEVLPEASGT